MKKRDFVVYRNGMLINLSIDEYVEMIEEKSNAENKVDLSIFDN